MAETLDRLLHEARRRRMTPDEIEAQRVNFAYGNAPEGDTGTMEDMQHASTFMKRNSSHPESEPEAKPK